jgi:DNA-binding transcriptional LysR family regulator
MFDELRHFLLVAEHGTLTAASRRAHLTQPALTASLHRLEAQMGARLFDRGRRGATATAAGLALMPRARAALAAVEDGRRAVAEVAGLHRGEVRIGAGATACTYLLPEVLARFGRRHPGVRFRLREGGSEATRGAVLTGELDIGIVTQGGGSSVRSGVSRPEAAPGVVTDARPAARFGLVEEPWLQDELVVVGTSDGEPTLRFVTFTRPSPTRVLFDHAFPEADVVMELSSIAAVKGNVRAGVGRALVSRAAVVHDLEAGLLVVFEDQRTPILRTLNLCHRGVERLPPSAAALRELLLS